MSDNISTLYRAPSSDFPSDVLKWLKANANPKMALKLMRCHKCFQHFPEFPYFVVKDIGTFEKGWNCLTILNKSVNVKDMAVVKRQFWITESIRLSHLPNFAAIFISKIAVCDITNLRLFQQKLSFNEFKILTNSDNLEFVELRNTNITFENGESVLIDSMLECVPNVKEFCHIHYESPCLPLNFASRMSEIDLWHLEKLELSMAFNQNFEQFTQYMGEYPHIKYVLEFVDAPTSEDEINHLGIYIQNILDIGVTDNPPPIITYPGQPQKQLFDLYSLTQRYTTMKIVFRDKFQTQ